MKKIHFAQKTLLISENPVNFFTAVKNCPKKYRIATLEDFEDIDCRSIKEIIKDILPITYLRTDKITGIEWSTENPYIWCVESMTKTSLEIRIIHIYDNRLYISDMEDACIAMYVKNKSKSLK